MFKIKRLVAATIAIIAIVFVCGFCLTGCDLEEFFGEVAPTVETSTEPATPITFVADLYDNHGTPWLSVEGKSFDIKPNKVKEYSYSTDGSWIYEYTLSSVVSVEVDGKNIETCGSTVLIYDTRLQKLDIEIPEKIIAEDVSLNENSEINSPEDYNFEEYWTINWWWRTKKLNNESTKARAVIIQSQEGDPICMFQGDNVSWDIPKNLPKTTEINIDGMKLYIHRANFAVVDLTLFK